MTFVLHDAARLDLCFDSLDGLSVGDALGAQFFMPGRSPLDLAAGRPPDGPWEWTDDTHMACSIVAELRDNAEIDQDRLVSMYTPSGVSAIISSSDESPGSRPTLVMRTIGSRL